MKTKINWAVGVIAMSILIVAALTVNGQKQNTPKVSWEYKVVSESDKISLNDLGAQGWELVTVEMGGAQEVYYFKRVK